LDAMIGNGRRRGCGRFQWHQGKECWSKLKMWWLNFQQAVVVAVQYAIEYLATILLHV
jgi:hypothetical protein